MAFPIRVERNDKNPNNEKYIDRIIEKITSGSEILSPEDNSEKEENINTIVNNIKKIINERVGDDKTEINRVKNDVRNYIIGNIEKLETFEKLRNNFALEIKNGPDTHRKSQGMDINIDELYGLQTGNIAEIIGRFIETLYEYIFANTAPKQRFEELITCTILQDGFKNTSSTIKNLLKDLDKSLEIAKAING